MSRSVRLEPPDGDETLAAITDELLLVHALCCGSAPVPVRASWGETWVVCVFERVLTAAERTLVAAGRSDRVRADRQALHDVVEPSLRAQVERLTGRRVRAYLTEIGLGDIAVEAFVFDP